MKYIAINEVTICEETPTTYGTHRVKDHMLEQFAGIGILQALTVATTDGYICMKRQI